MSENKSSENSDQPKHFAELQSIIKKHQIPVDSTFIVGGGILFVKGIRENNDIDFSTLDEKSRRSFFNTKTHEKYTELTPNVDCYFDRYRELGITDRDILEKELYFTHKGMRYVLPEIEIAYKLLVKNIQEGKRLQLENYIGNSKSWDWVLFSKLWQNYYAQKPIKNGKAKSFFVRLKRSIKAVVRKPQKLRRFIRKKVLSFLKIEVKPNKLLRAQLHTKISTAALIGNHCTQNDFLRYDVIMRYLALRGIKEKNESLMASYKKMQHCRGANDKSLDFQNLVESIEANGFSTDYPIPISAKDGRIVEGAHRFASAIYFDLDEIPVEISPESSGGYYGRNWFLQNNFSEEAMKLLDETKHIIFLEKGIYFPVIVWSPAKNYFSSISQMIRDRHSIVFEREITVTGSMADFIDDIYSIDNIAKWKVGFKKHLMQQYGNVFHLLLLEVPDPAYRTKPRYHSYLSTEMEKLKREVRTTYRSKIENYFYDIIMHTGDNYEHNKKIMEAIYKHSTLKKEEIA